MFPYCAIIQWNINKLHVRVRECAVQFCVRCDERFSQCIYLLYFLWWYNIELLTLIFILIKQLLWLMYTLSIISHADISHALYNVFILIHSLIYLINTCTISTYCTSISCFLINDCVMNRQNECQYALLKDENHTSKKCYLMYLH